MYIKNKINILVSLKKNLILNEKKYFTFQNALIFMKIKLQTRTLNTIYYFLSCNIKSFVNFNY